MYNVSRLLVLFPKAWAGQAGSYTAEKPNEVVETRPFVKLYDLSPQDHLINIIDIVILPIYIYCNFDEIFY